MTTEEQYREGSQLDIFGEVHDPFQKAAKRYGAWPETIWPVDHQDKRLKELKKLVGDAGEARGGGEVSRGTGKAGDRSYYKLTAGYMSIFNPVVAFQALAMYAPEGGHVYDPFGGGGTRAIMSAASGRTYLGTELRREEVDAVAQRIAGAGYEDRAKVVQGDARYSEAGTGTADFILTCPPYWNLEEYKGGLDDLSMMGEIQFQEALHQVAKDCYRVAQAGAYAIWVVGLHRYPDGRLAHLPNWTVQAHLAAGWMLADEAILRHTNNGALQRAGNFEKGKGHLVRMHEYVLVFAKPLPGIHGLPPRPPLRERAPEERATR